MRRSARRTEAQEAEASACDALAHGQYAERLAQCNQVRARQACTEVLVLTAQKRPSQEFQLTAKLKQTVYCWMQGEIWFAVLPVFMDSCDLKPQHQAVLTHLTSSAFPKATDRERVKAGVFSNKVKSQWVEGQESRYLQLFPYVAGFGAFQRCGPVCSWVLMRGCVPVNRQ